MLFKINSEDWFACFLFQLSDIFFFLLSLGVLIL